MVEIVLDDALETCEELEQECQPKAKLFQLNPALARMVARRAAWLRETVKTARLAIEGEAPPEMPIQKRERLLARWVDLRTGSRLVLDWNKELRVCAGPCGEYVHVAWVTSLETASVFVREFYPTFRSFPV